MQDIDKSKEQLATEVTHLRQRVAELEQAFIERKRAKETLRKSKKRERERLEELEAIMYSTPAVIFIAHDPQCRQMTGNRMAHELLRLPEGSNVSKSASPEGQPRNFRAMRNGRELPADQLPVQQAAQGREVRDYELDIIFEDDKARTIFGNATPLRDTSGKPRGAIGVFMDITERKQAEEALQKMGQTLEAVIQASPLPIFALDRERIVKAWNPAAERTFGWSAQEVIGRQYPAIPKEKMNEADTLFLRALEGGLTGVETHRQRKDGSLIYVSISTAPLRDGRGNTTGVMEVISDITERKQAEEALKESEKRFRIIFEGAIDGILLADIATKKFHSGNEMICKMLGYSLKEIKKLSVTDIHPKEALPFVMEQFDKLAREEITKTSELPVKRKDGSVFYAEISTVLLKLDGGSYLMGTFRDITERKGVEEALRESEMRYRSLFENSQDAILLTAPDGSVFDVNPAACQMFGRTAEEIKQIGRGGLIEPTDPRLGVALEERARKGKARAEITMIRADGTRFPVDITSTIFTDEQGQQRTSMIIRDMTVRRQAEEALRESEERYRTLIDNIDLGIILIDADHNVIMVNAAMGGKYNKPSSELIGKKCFREFEKRDAVCAHCPGVQTMATGKPAEVETEGVRDDLSRFLVRLRTLPVFDQDGTVVSFIEIAEDITERKRMENDLRESEGKYRSLVESSEDSIYLVDKDSTYLFMNKKHLSRLGVQSNQVIGRPYSEFHSPEETKDFAQRVQKVLQTGKALSYEYRSHRDNRYFIRTLNPVKVSKEDKPSAITVISKDITELKYSEEALREREAFNFALFQYNPVETIVVDLEGRVTGFNKAKEKSGDRLPTIGDLMYRDYAGKHGIDMRDELTKCIKSGKAKAFPERKYDDRYLSITISPFSQGALIISEDTTERKHAEELLQKERDTFFSILQKAPYGAVFLDNDGKSIFINTEFTAITGYSHEDIPTIEDWLRLAYPDKKYRDMVINTLRGDIAQDSGSKIFQNTFHRAFFRTFQVTCKDGTIKEIEFRPTALEDGGTIVMMADITERKRMHELLETAATEWRTTFDAISDAVCLLDQKGMIKRCNNAMMKMVGKPFSEIAGRACWEVLHGVLKPPKRCSIARVQETRRRETEVVSRDSLLFNISFDPLLDEGGNFLGGVHIMSDITKRMQAEKELKSSHEQLRDLTVYLQSVREEERTNIAREIHDELAQSLTALKMDLSWLYNKLPRDKMLLIEKTRSMNNLIDDTIRTVKRISAELRPGILDDLGLVAAIEWQAEEFQDRTGITCRVTVDPVDLTVDKDRSTAIFRIFQETLTNVARHAGATRITVSIKKTAEALTLRVTDNGTGITEEQIRDSKSFGLIGMRERVRPWEGKVSIKGIPGEGTTIEVKVPVGKK